MLKLQCQIPRAQPGLSYPKCVGACYARPPPYLTTPMPKEDSLGPATRQEAPIPIHIAMVSNIQPFYCHPHPPVRRAPAAPPCSSCWLLLCRLCPPAAAGPPWTAAAERPSPRAYLAVARITHSIYVSRQTAIQPAHGHRTCNRNMLNEECYATYAPDPGSL